MSGAAEPAIAVFAPTLVLTVVIERGAGAGELHLHAGGQGLWIARMAASLGGRVTLCAALGGETGRVLRGLLDGEDLEVRGVDCGGASGSYVHDRRSGQRQPVAEIAEAPLTRHELDDLYDATLVSALNGSVLVLTGPQTSGTVPGEVYHRLASDARANGVPVIADVTGEPLSEALAGGVTLVKLSDAELVAERIATSDDDGGLMAGIQTLAQRGADNVLVSRGPEASIALIDGALMEVIGPRLTAADPRGAGDSMTAAAAVGIARGLDLIETARLATAAGALNASRHGLGTGHRSEVEELLPHVRIEEIRVP
jgi:1-phosphofructokinase